jgi:hypothetical protein
MNSLLPLALVALLDLPLDMQGPAGEPGHGAQMAGEIREICQRRCEVAAFPLSRTGTDFSASRYAEGIEKALAARVRVVVIPSGARAGLDPAGEKRLERVLKKARKAGVPVLAAAGTGLRNPYLPEPLRTLVPQRFEQVWVVAASGRTPFEDETLRNAQNFGPELAFRVQAPSSSQAAVRLAAWIALQGRKPLAQLRRQIREKLAAQSSISAP